jgi:hypothetical protein
MSSQLTTQTFDQQVAVVYRKGTTQAREIAAVLEASYHRVFRALGRLGLRSQKHRETCVCGQKILQGFRDYHMRSTAHRQGRRLRALLSNPCLTLEEIGKRVGVTRERVRQIATKFGVDPNTRRPVCVLNKRTARIAKILADTGLQPWCDRYGLTLEPVLTADEKTARRRTCFINGHLCLIKSCCLRPARYARQNGGQGAAYVNIHPGNPEPEVAFLLFRLDPDTWFVIPRDKAPDHQTMFSLEPTLTGTRGTRHDWPDYKNAFWLLKNDCSDSTQDT